MDSIQDQARVPSLRLVFRPPRPPHFGASTARKRGQGFGQAKIKIDRLDDNEEQAETGGRGKRICCHRRDCAKPCSQPWTKGEGNGKAGSDDGHGRASRGLVRDVAGHGRRQLNVAFGKPADDATGDEGPKVGGGNPEEDGENIAAHGGEESGTAAMAVGKAPDQRGSNGL